MKPGSEVYAGLRYPGRLRRHQAEALDALDRAGAAGRTRSWVVLPPGAGKTLVGLETIRRLGRRAVVLSPNAAIQEQWVRGWRDLRDAEGGNAIEVGTDRALLTPVTSLTYQSLAVFDDDREPGEPAPESELERLHHNGLAFVHRLRKAGPITLVLDECHHLLEVWGRLLAEVLQQLPEATVLGLTATPATSLTADQAALVDELFGEPVYAASIPAVVREGHLAPFADLIWLTTPTAQEAEWLETQSVRFRELTTRLLDPEFATVPFLEWVDRTFAGDLPFRRIAEQRPDIADAALRLQHAGLVTLPDHVPVLEQHQHDPTADDWAALVDAWYDDVLSGSTDLRDADAREALRMALPAVGYRLTRNGVQRGRSTVDRVLARSESKARAMAEIVAAEHRNLGDRLAMLVICDHEEATATRSIDLRGVLEERAGSARLALATLLADPGTRDLAPVMVTGRTVAAAPEVLHKLRTGLDIAEQMAVGPPDADGIGELIGPWSPREWVRAVTEFFERGECRVLIGTRALLGEGWDAPTASGLVDLSAARTPGTVVQTRGRTLRLHPGNPEKVAINWTVCCVSDEHPNGDHDWRRSVDKHRGYFGVDESGDVVDGVAHIHPTFSPYAPPDVATFGAANAQMLVRAERRRDIAAAWRVGEPYDDEVRVSVWVRGPYRERLPDAAVERESPRPPEVVLTREGLVWHDAQPSEPAKYPLVAGLAGVAALLLLVCSALGPGPWWLFVALAGALAWWGVAETRRAAATIRDHRRAQLERVPGDPDPLSVGCALADALRDAGLVSAGAEAVDWATGDDGRLRVRLDAGGATSDESRVFAEAYAELMGPVGRPRYLVPRYLLPPVTDELFGKPLIEVQPSGVVWHPVPTVLGANADLAQTFARAWTRWLGGGDAVYTGNPEGAGALAAVRGSNPFDASSVLRLSWR